MSEDEKKVSWWTTLPGVLTGIATLLTAIAGILVAVKGFVPTESVSGKSESTISSPKVTSDTVAQIHTSPATSPSLQGGNGEIEKIDTLSVKSSQQDLSQIKIPSEWEVTQLPDPTAQGRLAISVPDAYVHWEFKLSKDGSTVFESSGSGSYQRDLLPGVYQASVSNIRLGDVPINSGKELRVPLGALDAGASSGTIAFYSADKTIRYFENTQGGRSYALPAGSYLVRLGDQYLPVVIKAGKVTKL